MPDADLCDHGPESLYISVDTVTVAQAVPTLSIANISNPTSHHISRCEPLKLRFNLGATGGPFDVYDTRLVVNLNGNYHYLDGTASISLNDEGGSAVGNFEPAKDGDTLTWNIGDVR